MASNPSHSPKSTLSPDDARLLIESIVDYAIFIIDPDGFIVTWNPGAERLKGYRAEEIIGQHFSKFYSADDVAAGKPQRELEIAREVGRVEDEGWRFRKDGTRFWGNVVITALREADGKLRGFAKVTRDLTQKKLAEEDLQRSEERFHHLVDAVTDYAFFMLDPSGRIATWNAGARKTKGYEVDEIIGKNFSIFYTEEDRADGKPARILEAVRRDGRVEDESWRVRKDGTRFWANVVLTAIRNGKGELVGFAKVTRDLTARRQAEETERNLLREQTARAVAEHMKLRAEETNRIKDEFLATVSHELRTPLNAIVGWSAMLRQRQLDPAIAKAIEVIDRNAQAQVRIIEDILDVSRIITGKLHVEPRPTDLVAIVHEAIEVVRHSASVKGISIEFTPSATMHLLVGDPDRLQQVVWNLLSNAVKFGKSGGSIRVSLAQEQSKLVLKIADDGQGIDPEFLPYVFDRFKQADASTTRRYGGLGLGLALVRHIVELHGGTVAAHSDGVGKGASFALQLPVRAVLPAPARERGAGPGQKRTPAPAPTLLQGVSVLVVDDDADARDLLVAVLDEAGAAVETARSAQEAFEALQRLHPQVLVSDIGMAGEDGYSLLRRIRTLPAAEGGGIPSIALTAYTRVEDRTKALEAGFTTHIGKPVDPADLVTAVAKLASFARR